MISGTRNNLQARIDEKAEVLRRLITSTPVLIKEEFKLIDAEAKSISESESNGDPDVCNSIYRSIYASQRHEDEEWMLLEFYRSMVLLIYSYLETTMKSMIKRPSKRQWSIGFLQYSYTQIKDQYELSGFPEIEFFWPNYSSFLEKRKLITHGYKDDNNLNGFEETLVEEEELIIALEGAHHLLRSIADAIDIKSRGYVNKSIDYLWVPQ